jgi:hypothetical protein
MGSFSLQGSKDQWKKQEFIWKILKYIRKAKHILCNATVLPTLQKNLRKMN